MVKDARYREIAGPDLTEQVLDQTFSLWNDGLSRRAYGQWNLAQTRTRWGGRHLQRVGLVDAGRVVASAKRYLLKATLHGSPVQCLGIGAVFTAPEARGQGLARELIHAMLEDGEARGCTMALLFSEIGSEYYERLGFQVWPREEVVIDVPRTRRGAPATLVRALEPADLGDLAEISNRYGTETGFSLNRQLEWIEFQLIRRRLRAGLGPQHLRQVEAFVSEEGHKPVSYLIVSRGPEGTRLEECGDRDPRGSRVGAMLEVLVEREPSLDDRQFRAWLPAGFHPPQVRLQPAGPAAEIMMVRGIGHTEPIPPPTSGLTCWASDIF